MTRYAGGHRAGAGRTAPVGWVLALVVVGAGAYFAGSRTANNRMVVEPSSAPAPAPSGLPARIDLSQLTPLLPPPFRYGNDWASDRDTASAALERLKAYAARYNAGGLGESERENLYIAIRAEVASYELATAQANALFKAAK